MKITLLSFFKISFLFLISVLCTKLNGQQSKAYEWHNPLESLEILEGQGWENIGYNRLPNDAQNLVRDKVWFLSRQSAGLSIRFQTNADSLMIEYEVDGEIAMDHMSATGVSGVDLYGKNSEGKWLWYRGKRSFGDTIQYYYKTEKSIESGREYQLYLPLYNNCKNLKIGIPEGSKIKFITQRKEKPIVVYGTSIAQGACASRPGMAWTNIVQRKLDYPVVNLGFSGNGRLESEVLKFVTDIDARVYVLDCLPNLGPSETNTEKEIKERIRRSIRHIRSKRPKARIVLMQHAGYSDGEVDDDRKEVYETLNRWQAEVFFEFKEIAGGRLQLAKVKLTNDAYVDGTHPTDLGMEQYAQAYEKALEKLLGRY